MTLRPEKHEKVARIGRISNVFRIAGAQSAEQSVGIMGLKYLLTPTSYYIDKTLMIKKLLDCPGKVNLFMRPHRFGKTLNQSMIRRFFELEYDFDGNIVDNGVIFEDLKIASCGETYLRHFRSLIGQILHRTVLFGNW